MPFSKLEIRYLFTKYKNIQQQKVKSSNFKCNQILTIEKISYFVRGKKLFFSKTIKYVSDFQS